MTFFPKLSKPGKRVENSYYRRLWLCRLLLGSRAAIRPPRNRNLGFRQLFERGQSRQPPFTQNPGCQICGRGHPASCRSCQNSKGRLGHRLRSRTQCPRRNQREDVLPGFAGSQFDRNDSDAGVLQTAQRGIHSDEHKPCLLHPSPHFLASRVGPRRFSPKILSPGNRPDRKRDFRTLPHNAPRIPLRNLEAMLGTSCAGVCRSFRVSCLDQPLRCFGGRRPVRPSRSGNFLLLDSILEGKEAPKIYRLRWSWLSGS